MRTSVSTQTLLPFGVEGKELPRLVESLAEAARRRTLDEKIFVAPSLAVGHEIVERLARSGVAWINLRVESPRSLAHGVVGRALVEEGRTLLSRVQSLALIEQACAQALTERSYFGALRERPGLHRAIQSTFDELREAGITAETLPADAFADSEKVADVRSVLRIYEKSLAEGKFVDRSDVIRRAIEELRRGPSASEAVYLVPDGLELSPGEKEFLDLLSRGRIETLESDLPETWTRRASHVRFVHALGEENEIREIFRRLQGEGIPIDEAEILYVDRDPYASLAFELAREHGIPCTFADGVAVTYTRPGQAALGFLRWIARDYETDALHAILAAGNVDLGPVSSGTKPPGSVAAARVLRLAGIGWGRERHLLRLDAYIARLEWEASRRPSSSGPDPEVRAAQSERKIAAARMLRRFVARLLDLVPPEMGGEVSLSGVARAARQFVSEFARIGSELEGIASTAIQKLFEEFETVPTSPMTSREAAERLAAAIAELAAGPDRSRPGKLHVGNYRTGGYSGRAHTFVVGLDAARHPGTGLQDPVLLDAERREINRRIDPRGLALRGARPEENSIALRACLSRLRGEVTISYSCWDLLEARERFPAPFVLDVYRSVAGNEEADYSSLENALGDPSGFLAEDGRALDEPEWWLTRLARTGPQDGETARVVRSEFPWLKDSWRAATDRAGGKFTVYDGWLKSSGGSLDPRTNAKPISCSAIQQLARCPYSYFLERVLGLEAPERIERDPTVWLDPLQAGLLQHEVFRRFFTEISTAGEKPSLARHAARIEEIAREEIRAWRGRVPPASEASFAARQEEILATCRSFVQLEEDHCSRVDARWFEVAFGMPWGDPPKPPGSLDPVEIRIGRGRSFLLRGQIDRIDEAKKGIFEIWDYKTGGMFGIVEGRGLRGGRQIQPALYASAVEKLLERCGEKGKVSRSGYFFPSAKGRGRRIAEDRDPDELSRVLNVLFDLLREGAFPHAPNPKACEFCEFQGVCGDVKRAAEESREKIADSGNAVLAGYRGLDVS